jgi:hypothetical protein
MTTWSRVQGTLNTTGGATSTTVTLTSTVTSGNIVVGAILLDAVAVTSITDDKGNAYQLINYDGVYFGSFLTITGFSSVGPITNGAKILTITYPSSAVSWTIFEEFSAGSPLTAISVDGTQLLIDSAATSTPNFQTLQSNDLLWSASFCTAAVTAGAGWTVGQGNSTQQMSMWKQGGAPSSSLAATLGSNGGAVWTTVFGIAPVTRSTWLLRQNQIERTVATASSGSIVFPNTVASGNIVIGGIAVGTGGGNITDITSITDDKGNNYTIVPNYINASGRAMFWSNGPITNGPQTITCNTSVTETIIYFMVNEFVPPPGTSIYAIDGTPSMTNQGSGPGPYSSGTVTTNTNGDLLYGFADIDNGNTAPANSFSTLNGQNLTWSDAYLIQQTAGSSVFTVTGASGGANAVALAAFSAKSPNTTVILGTPRRIFSMRR